MKRSPLSRSRYLVGVILVIASVLILLLTEGGYATAGAVALGVLGLVSIAISRRTP